MDQARGYEIAGYPVTCTHCQNDRFFTRRAILGSSSSVSLLTSDWPNAGATNYICADCGHLMWFFDLPVEADAGESAFSLDALLTEDEAVEETIEPSTDYEAPESTMMPEPTECLSCGEMIPSHQTKCPACGWSYRSDPEA